MKTITKTAAIGISCLILMTFPVSAETIPTENDNLNNDTVYIDGVPVPQEMLLQEEALNAYDALYNRFEQDEDNNYILPDDYAGEYIDDSYNLVVQLTTDDYSEYEFLLDEFDCVVFKTVEYSNNELTELAREARTSIIETESKDNIEYVSSCVDVKNNKALIEIGTKDLNVRSNITSYSYRNLPLEIKYAYIEDKVQQDSSVETSRNDLMPTASNSETVTLIGGNKIEVIGATMTMTICGTHNGENSLLTCGHGVLSVDSVKYDGVYVGGLSKRHFEDEGYGDYSIFKLNDNAVMTNKVKSEKGTVSITATKYNVPVGTVVYCYGQASKRVYSAQCYRGKQRNILFKY
ncbi:MAG: hypothetical protein K2O14_03550 [Oscillospiraceae bacterium]|nr:hypothetical protein [Oscillospiraceae bacterium]